MRKVCDDSRSWIRGTFEKLGRDAGARNPDLLARQLVLLYDGATVAAQMDKDVGAARRAREMALTLLEVAIA